ncbi:succinoglycan biosynthesis protein ExoM [Ciceribacter naphthalenivorans]|uniref:Succinoglycan biosynthesis protein ExoM n=2 Tax=Alphaproteobacteria TaxID=28211 RepID=A0A512HII5_9HYPH|nr:succinoglycan biosynthesis protein ExoM [Ciceribacter naphthalenivorans]GLR20900.1 succinoglycan biosynthesis protein ExoM [Ciceribacter naphthalenivorans]GLT03756.1 succinoglycan biosynthesis protein ExoM [Sphingomonas psychrolutea]
MESVVVAIASLGRPSLAETVRSLAAVVPGEGRCLSVLVADDSRDGAATQLVAGLELPGLEVVCIPVAAGNISAARNALLDGVKSDWLVFIDDDEWVEPDWLERLFDCQREYQADVVIGPVFPAYPSHTPDWLVRANALYADWGHRGKRLQTGRGGNTLVHMPFFRKHGLRFDPALGQSGGEDTAFFAEAAHLGAVIVATDDAIVHEVVPDTRLNPRYILQRALRSGQSYGISRKAKKSGPLWSLLFGANAAAKCVIAAVLATIYRPLDRGRSFRMQQKFALNLGKLRAVFNLPLAQLYSRPD